MCGFPKKGPYLLEVDKPHLQVRVHKTGEIEASGDLMYAKGYLASIIDSYFSRSYGTLSVRDIEMGHVRDLLRGGDFHTYGSLKPALPEDYRYSFAPKGTKAQKNE